MRKTLLISLIAAVAVTFFTALPGTPASAAVVRKPAITPWHIPYDQKRKADMRAYANRHYGLNTFKLKTHNVIVEHYAVASSVTSIYNTFAPNRPDGELGELPGVCAHYAIAKSGQIFKFVNTSIMCRHTVGLNYTSIGIEHVGFSDAEVMNNPKQLKASLRLTRWLRCRFKIKAKNVIGHNESVKSPWHHEEVASLRNQTHGDFKRSTMLRYRNMIRAKGC